MRQKKLKVFRKMKVCYPEQFKPSIQLNTYFQIIHRNYELYAINQISLCVGKKNRNEL